MITAYALVWTFSNLILFFSSYYKKRLFRIFLVFSNKQSNFTTNQCEKMSYPFSIRHQDSNTQCLNNESSPITTRPGSALNNQILDLNFECQIKGKIIPNHDPSLKYFEHDILALLDAMPLGHKERKYR